MGGARVIQLLVFRVSSIVLASPLTKEMLAAKADLYHAVLLILTLIFSLHNLRVAEDYSDMSWKPERQSCVFGQQSMPATTCRLVAVTSAVDMAVSPALLVDVWLRDGAGKSDRIVPLVLDLGKLCIALVMLALHLSAVAVASQEWSSVLASDNLQILTSQLSFGWDNVLAFLYLNSVIWFVLGLVWLYRLYTAEPIALPSTGLVEEDRIRGFYFGQPTGNNPAECQFKEDSIQQIVQWCLSLCSAVVFATLTYTYYGDSNINNSKNSCTYSGSEDCFVLGTAGLSLVWNCSIIHYDHAHRRLHSSRKFKATRLAITTLLSVLWITSSILQTNRSSMHMHTRVLAFSFMSAFLAYTAVLQCVIMYMYKEDASNTTSRHATVNGWTLLLATVATVGALEGTIHIQMAAHGPEDSSPADESQCFSPGTIMFPALKSSCIVSIVFSIALLLCIGRRTTERLGSLFAAAFAIPLAPLMVPMTIAAIGKWSDVMTNMDVVSARVPHDKAGYAVTINNFFVPLGWSVSSLSAAFGWSLSVLICSLGWGIWRLCGVLGWGISSLCTLLGWSISSLFSALGWPLSSLLVVLDWCVSNLFFVLNWCSSSLFFVLNWCISSLSGALGLSFYGLIFAFGWCVSRFFFALGWSVSSLFVAVDWCISSLSVVLGLSLSSLFVALDWCISTLFVGLDWSTYSLFFALSWSLVRLLITFGWLSLAGIGLYHAHYRYYGKRKVHGCAKDDESAGAHVDGLPGEATLAPRQWNARNKINAKYLQCQNMQDCWTFVGEKLKLDGLPDVFEHQHDRCYCVQCFEPHKADLERGAELYMMPEGWCRFGLNVRTLLKQYRGDEKVVAQMFGNPSTGADGWPVAYHGTFTTKVRSILDEGRLLKPGEKMKSGHVIGVAPGHFDDHKQPAGGGFDYKQVFLSPSIRYCAEYCKQETPRSTHMVAFQARIIPYVREHGCETLGGAVTERDISRDQMEWSVPNGKCAILYGLLIRRRG